MHLMPSFAGDEFNIFYNNCLSQMFREISAGSLNPAVMYDAVNAARDYDDFMEIQGYEYNSNDVDVSSTTDVLHQCIMDCVDAMQTDGGWELPSLKMVRTQLSQEILTRSFFMSFTET